jgi:xylobiose transport system substrate-binding protein
MEGPFISRRQFIVGATAGAALILSGCGTNDSASQKPSSTSPTSKAIGATASIWVLSEPENVAQKYAVDQFNKHSSVKMKLVVVPSTDSMNTKVRIAIKTSERPNMFFNWAGGSIRPYVLDDLLVDLTPSLNAKPAVRKSFLPSILDAATVNGHYYGIPIEGVEPNVMFYNKKIFKEYSLSPPDTWSELLQVVKVLKSKGVTPILLPGATDWTVLMYLEYISARLGPYSVFEDLQTNNPKAWENPIIKQTLEYCLDLVNVGAFGSTYKTLNYSDGIASALFAKGEGAMMLMLANQYATFVTSYPKFAPDLGWFPFPTIEGGTGDPDTLTGNPTNWLSVVKTTPAVDAACVDFLETQLNTEEFVAKLIAVGDIPAVEGIEDLLAKSPYGSFSTGIYELVKKAPYFELSWDQAVSESYGPDLDTAIQQVFFKEISPQQFVDKMAKYAEEA